MKSYYKAILQLDSCNKVDFYSGYERLVSTWKYH